MDGIVSQIGRIDGTNLVQAKGHNYTLEALLGAKRTVITASAAHGGRCNDGPFRAQQRFQRVVVTLRLNEVRPIDSPDLADDAVHRRDQRLGIRIDRAGIRPQRPREKFIEAAVRQRVGLGGFGHVGPEPLHELRDERVLDRRRAYSRRSEHYPRQKMLGQQVLHRDEQAVAQAHVPTTTATAGGVRPFANLAQTV